MKHLLFWEDCVTRRTFLQLQLPFFLLLFCTLASLRSALFFSLYLHWVFFFCVLICSIDGLPTRTKRGQIERWELSCFHETSFSFFSFFFFRFLFVYYAQVLVFPSYLRLNVLRTRNRIYPWTFFFVAARGCWMVNSNMVTLFNTFFFLWWGSAGDLRLSVPLQGLWLDSFHERATTTNKNKTAVFFFSLLQHNSLSLFYF